MRCWNPDCRKLITTPEIINGEPGTPGIVRQMERGEVVPDPGIDWATNGITTNFTCPHCGTQYRQVTLAVAKRDVKRDRHKGVEERGDGWD